ncbi:MAG: hypothetical protein ACQER9_02695 [Nanobdellota archaeon]
MQIIMEKGYAVDKDVEIIINSANGLLMLGSSGAGKIRKLSGKLNKEEYQEYTALLDKLPLQIKEFYQNQYKVHGWELGYAQISGLKLLLKNGKPYEPGQSIFDQNWKKESRKKIIHSITMSYDTSKKPVKRIYGTKKSVKESYKKAFEIIKIKKAKSVALPIPISRPGYGITPQESYEVVRDTLKTIKNIDIKVILCFDNKYTKKYLDDLNGKKTKAFEKSD